MTTRRSRTHKPMINAAAETYAPIAMVGDLQITAAADDTKAPTFTMLAYTGGLLRLQYWEYPVVVELAGMTVPSQRLPVRMQHEARQGVGHTTAIAKDQRTLTATGVISRSTPYARDVVDSHKNGFPWQVSMGAAPNEVVFIADGEKVQANGQTFDGPAYRVAKSTLSELSFVDLGADTDTSAAIAAQQKTDTSKRNDVMKIQQLRILAKKYEQKIDKDKLESAILAAAEADEDDKTFTARLEAMARSPKPTAQTLTPPVQAAAGVNADEMGRSIAAAIAAENTRCQSIRAEGAKLDISAETIDKCLANTECSIEAARGEFLNDIAARRHNNPVNGAPAGIVVDRDLNPMRVIEAAALMSAGLGGTALVASHGEKVVTAADREYKGRMGLQQLIMEAAFAVGYSGRYFTANPRAAVMAAFSNADFSGLLSNIANKFMAEAFNNVDQAWRKIARTRPVKDFKTITSYRMTGGFDFQRVGPGGELKHATAGEASYTNKADTYGRMFGITREDLINDDLGVLSQTPRRIGRGGALTLNEVFWKEFQDNTADFYSAARGNLAGSAALAIDTLSAAVQAFIEQTDEDGKPLGIQPAILVVGAPNDVTAKQLYKDALIVDGSTTKKPNGNPHQGLFEAVTTPYITTTFGAAATTDWYLAANPNDEAVIEVVFLNGQEMPTVESADADFNTLGIQFRGYFDFGCRKQEYRAAVRRQVASL